MIAHGVLAVHLVVGCHDGPGIALADGDLEASEIELAGGTLRETLIDTGAVGLLRVDGEVLGRYACTLTLHALDIGSSDLTREQRILGVILEVATTEGIAVQVHTGAEDDVAAILLGLVADGFAHLADELGVPCRGEARANGEGCGVIGLVGTLTRRVDTDACRAVGEDSGRDAETRDGGRGSCGSCHKIGLTAHNGLITEEVVGTSYEELCLLLEGHSLEHLVDIVGAELWLGICCHSE